MEGNQQMSEEMSILAIEVSETQRETIRQLFAHNDWEFNKVPIEENITNSQASEDTEESDPHFEEYVINQNQEAEECQHCLCRPGITLETNRQLWWLVECEHPNRSNSHRRKDKYKRFWTMLFHRNVWRDPRHLDRKRRALQRDPHHRQYIYHRRDIMPKCVVDLVRTWLPNLNDQPYLKNMW